MSCSPAAPPPRRRPAGRAERRRAPRSPHSGSARRPARRSIRALLRRCGANLLRTLPASSELAQLHIWPWWPWEPWFDCDPDVIFKVTQVLGREQGHRRRDHLGHALGHSDDPQRHTGRQRSGLLHQAALHATAGLPGRRLPRHHGYLQRHRRSDRRQSRGAGSTRGLSQSGHGGLFRRPALCGRRADLGHFRCGGHGRLLSVRILGRRRRDMEHRSARLDRGLRLPVLGPCLAGRPSARDLAQRELPAFGHRRASRPREPGAFPGQQSTRRAGASRASGMAPGRTCS